MISGIVKFDKPAGWTSFDVVNKVRNILEKGYREENDERTRIKVGHSGTLDPFATGLLLVAYGKCTKKLGGMTKQDKTYVGTMVLGSKSDTGDIEGEITSVDSVEPSIEELGKAMQSFLGEIQQVPPAYSAIKVDGVRAYKLARKGQEVKLEPRTVTVHSIELIQYQYPEAKFSCRVSSGTYIRSLGQDIADKMGTYSYLRELRRTSIDLTGVEGALDPAVASYEDIQKASANCS